MPRLKLVRALTLKHAPAPELPAFLRAASRLVRAERNLYVIGDNLHYLGIFRAGGGAPGSLSPEDIADVAPLGPDGIFTSAQVTEIVRAIEKVNAHAEAA